MKFAVMELFQQPENKPPRQVLEETLEQARAAEELGYDSIWMAEHHFSVYGIVGSPLMMAAAIAAQTTRIRIGTAVLVLPFYNPVRLAEEIALVDQLSGGRIDIGYGRGYQPTEFKGLGVDQSEARQRTHEIREILELAWTQESVTYHGEFYHLDDVQIVPKPYQKPHPPLWQAAVSLSTFEQAGAEGNPILTSPNFTPLEVVQDQFARYTRALTENGYDPNQYSRPLMQQVYVGEDAQDGRQTPEPYAMWYQRLLGTLVPGAKGETVKGYEQWSRISENIERVSYDQVYEHAAIFGDAEQAIQKVRRLEEIGVNTLICWFSFGGIPHDKVMKSMERFAREVMPAFQEQPASQRAD